MRCKICDFAPDTFSYYHSGLVMPKDIKMSEDPHTGEVTCNCFTKSKAEEEEADGFYLLDEEVDE